MNRFAAFVHFFWPWLEKRSAEEARTLEEKSRSDDARIAALNIGRAPTVALDEIRRLADSEAERRRGTEQKAATYLPLVAALIPLVLTVVSALWEKKAGSAPIWANMLLLGLAVAYMAAAGWWAFRVLKVAISHEPGLGDFEKSLGSQHPTATLAGRLLLHTRRNQEGINWKVSCIKMAHEFLLRAFLAFSFLLALNIGWYLMGLLLQLLAPAPASKIETAQQALAAVTRLETLADRMKTAPAWIVLEEDCRSQIQRPGAMKFIAGSTLVAKTSPASLKPQKDETIATREIRVVCDGKTLAEIRAWFLPRRLPGKQTPLVLPAPLATPVIVSLRKSWPPQSSDQAGDPTKLPATLLRQTAVVRGADGQTVALILTDIGPSLVDPR
jgi:hypothetical protein